MNPTQYLSSISAVFLLASCGGDSGGASNNTTPSSALNSSLPTSSPSTASSSLASLSVAISNSSKSSSSSSSSSSAAPQLIAYGSNVMQVGELRLPQTTSEKAVPLVIIIHGGCWVSGYADYQFMGRFAQAVTNLGYATWNIEYRALGTGGNWPVIFQDVSQAVDYTRTLAKSYPVDAAKVAAIGHSAGGHLALWAGSRENLKADSDLYIQNPLAIRGVISLAGIANVTRKSGCNNLANDVIGMPVTSPGEDLTQRLKESSPLQMLPIRTKTILISGSADTIVPPAMGDEYSMRASELGDHSLHYSLQGLGHFDLIDSTKTNWGLYQQSLQEFFKD